LICHVASQRKAAAAGLHLWISQIISHHLCTARKTACFDLRAHGLPKKGCLLPEHRNRISLCSCLLGPHAVCLLPDGTPAPHGQALAPEDVTSSLQTPEDVTSSLLKKIKNEEMQHTPIREAAARLHLPPPTPTARRNASSQHPTRTTYW